LTNNAGGALAAVGGNVDVFGTITNASGAQIVVGGDASAVFHDTVTNNGQLFVMPGAEALMLENLSFSGSSALSLELACTEVDGGFGQVEVGGQATLQGTLEVTLASGYTPQLGDAFQVLTAAGGRTGTFGTQVLPALGGGLTWNVDYLPNSLTLSVVAGGGGLTADFDLDGDVDAADLTRWKSGFPTAAGANKETGDANGDGDVDGADFLAWQREEGSAPAVSSTSPVPEPPAAGLAVMATAILSVRRRM
jgi:hypothetical protein